MYVRLDFVILSSCNFVLMNNPFDYSPSPGCDDAFRHLRHRLETLKSDDNPDDQAFLRELEAGKMLGVLIARDGDGATHTLYAFSGQLADRGFHYPGFVDPVFDYLQPDGYFKRMEADISRQNSEISRFEDSDLSAARDEYTRVKEVYDAKISEYRKRCRRSKEKREARREAGDISDTEAAEMIRQSQHEKAELRRLRKRVADDLQPYADRLKEAEARLEAMKRKRHQDSVNLQKWLFDSFMVLDALGESRSLSDIFAETPAKIPPSGAGECCAPKLLQAAYLRGWKPESIAEYWYGAPKEGEVRIHGEHYPACRGKCLPVLGWMLRGVEIDPPLDADCGLMECFKPEVIYENRWFCVVDKPAGMLSVPGKGAAISLQEWLEQRYGAAAQVRMAHRLDRDTSGLMVATFGADAYKEMQSLFATRRVSKTYVATLEGDFESLGIPRKGNVSLPLSPDWLDRPRQRVDPGNGKEALTDYEFTGVSGGRSRVLFHPRTGRTHQLRVHAASEAGLGMPIVGDPLYGRRGIVKERLHLHAAKLEFTFPLDGESYCFESPAPF